MNKGYVYGAGTAILVLATATLYARQKKLKNNKYEPSNLDLAGVPDQLKEEKEDLEQLENAKMVSEGSQFGVKYFNEARQEKEELAARKGK